MRGLILLQRDQINVNNLVHNWLTVCWATIWTFLIINVTLLINNLGVRDTCETDQWRNNCNGEWRRFYIEEIYRKKMNKELYNQKDMDTYMKYKNNIYHNSFLPTSWLYELLFAMMINNQSIIYLFFFVIVFFLRLGSKLIKFVRKCKKCS